MPRVMVDGFLFSGNIKMYWFILAMLVSASQTMLIVLACLAETINIDLGFACVCAFSICSNFKPSLLTKTFEVFYFKTYLFILACDVC